jgi:glyoxylase-like metal-dependent hydrolase (beta-lactamase superfamily II)
MRGLLMALFALGWLVPATAGAQGAAALDDVAAALGANGLKTLQITASGSSFALGQSFAPGVPWPRSNVPSFTRTINYETASLRDELVRTQAEDPPRGGGNQPIRGELRQTLALSGQYAWNVVMGNPVPAPIALADRQLQLWVTPHGVVKAAAALGATRYGRTIVFAVPDRFRVRAYLDDHLFVERVEAVLAHPVLGDMAVELTYADYKDFGGVKFPTRIKQTSGGFPVLDLTVSDVRPNAAADIEAPEPVRQTAGYYAKVVAEKATDGVWYLAGGSHHSVAIEMKDYVIVVEAPLNDERTVATLAEVERLVPGKPIRYVVNSHHHFDHTGGVRAAAGWGATIVTHEVNRAFLERVLAAPATVGPDYLARAGRRTAPVEGVRTQRTLTDGTRTVEVLHLSGNLHAEGLLVVYLPQEKLLIEADAFTPGPAGAAPPSPPNPYSAHLADAIARSGIAVERLLPLHGRIVPLSELRRAVGRPN